MQHTHTHTHTHTRTHTHTSQVADMINHRLKEGGGGKTDSSGSRFQLVAGYLFPFFLVFFFPDALCNISGNMSCGNILLSQVLNSLQLNVLEFILSECS